MYTPGDQPDPEFLAFYEAFHQRLFDVEVPGMDDPSWDRRAAYLLWLAEGNEPTLERQMAKARVRRRTTTIIVEDDFGGLV